MATVVFPARVLSLRSSVLLVTLFSCRVMQHEIKWTRFHWFLICIGCYIGKLMSTDGFKKRSSLICLECSPLPLQVQYNVMGARIGGLTKVIVFSQFWMHLNIVAKHLRMQDIAFEVFSTVKTPPERLQSLDTFQVSLCFRLFSCHIEIQCAMSSSSLLATHCALQQRQLQAQAVLILTVRNFERIPSLANVTWTEQRSAFVPARPNYDNAHLCPERRGGRRPPHGCFWFCGLGPQLCISRLSVGAHWGHEPAQTSCGQSTPHGSQAADQCWDFSHEGDTPLSRKYLCCN